MRPIILLIFMLFLLNSYGQIRSDQVDQEEIYTAYQLDYDQHTGLFAISAQFTVGGKFGTQVKLSDQSIITANDIPLRQSEDLFKQIIYKHEEIRSTDNLGGFVLKYINEDDVLFLNIASVIGQIKIVNPKAASLSSGLFLEWTIAGDISGHSLSIKIDSGSFHKTISYGNIYTGTGTYQIAPSHLQELPDRNFSVQVCHTRINTAINAPSVGGELRSRYCSKRVSYYADD